MDITYLLTLDRFDRDGISKGSQHLLFSDRGKAEDFARKIASDFFECGPLPESGVFGSPRIKGDVVRYEDDYTISWTVQPKEAGGSLGGGYDINVKPVKTHSFQTRLDFWNQQ